MISFEFRFSDFGFIPFNIQHSKFKIIFALSVFSVPSSLLATRFGVVAKFLSASCSSCTSWFNYFFFASLRLCERYFFFLFFFFLTFRTLHTFQTPKDRLESLSYFLISSRIIINSDSMFFIFSSITAMLRSLSEDLASYPPTFASIADTLLFVNVETTVK